MLKNFEVRKFMAIVAIIAYILLMAIIVGVSLFTDRDIKIPPEFSAFTGMVVMIIGQYFGKSTMAEGSRMNKDP